MRGVLGVTMGVDYLSMWVLTLISLRLSYREKIIQGGDDVVSSD